MMVSLLNWQNKGGYREALLGTLGDGVLFCLTFHPTCYRRGKWRLLVEILPGDHHHDWGCFDGQDQPQRYYHQEQCALAEAESLAQVLYRDRYKGEEI